MNEREGKREFAKLLLQHPGEPYKIARILCNRVGITDEMLMRAIGERWPEDADVLADMQEMLAEQGEDAFLPSRSDVARKLWQIAEMPAVDSETRIKALKEYAALRGFNQDAPGVTINVVNKVMAIRDHGSDAEWERRLLEQQGKLIEHVA